MCSMNVQTKGCDMIYIWKLFIEWATEYPTSALIIDLLSLLFITISCACMIVPVITRGAERTK